MNSRRLLVALLLALLLSGGVTFFISRKLVGHGAPHSNVQHYVAPTRALQAGDVLKPEDLTLVEWPSSISLPHPFTKVGDVAGRAVIYPVAASQPIPEGYLAAPGSGIGLTTKIPEGMRATAVKSDEIVGVAGFLFPGSHVDVLVTFRADGLPSPATQIVLQDVEILTIGQKLVLASSQGSIQFVLRNGGDHTRVPVTPIQVSQLVGAQPVATLAAITPRRHLPMKEADTVETILGEKRSTKSFE